MTDYADIIRSRVTMPELLDRYGLANLNSRHRIACPIHHGKNRNFSYRDHWFKCFVCGAHGTVIDFAMQYHGLPFKAALKQINDDMCLGLPIGQKPSDAERAEQDRIARERRRERQERARVRDAARRRYDAALAEWVRIDRIVQNGVPSGVYGGIDAEFADALQQKDAAEFELRQAELDLWRLKHDQQVSV